MSSGGCDYEYPIERLVRDYKEEFIQSGYQICHYDIQVDSFTAWLCERLEEYRVKEREEAQASQQEANDEPLRIYTDGGCNPNPGVGAWAFVVTDGDRIVYSNYGRETETTNNKMELNAVIQAMKYVEGFEARRRKVVIVTDSEYVKKGLTEWMPNWKKLKWRTSSGKPVKNLDLWQILDDLYDPEKHIMEWTRGHVGTEFNEFADELCTEEIRKAKS